MTGNDHLHIVQFFLSLVLLISNKLQDNIETSCSLERRKLFKNIFWKIYWPWVVTFWSKTVLFKVIWFTFYLTFAWGNHWTSLVLIPCSTVFAFSQSLPNHGFYFLLSVILLYAFYQSPLFPLLLFPYKATQRFDIAPFLELTLSSHTDLFLHTNMIFT